MGCGFARGTRAERARGRSAGARRARVRPAGPCAPWDGLALTLTQMPGGSVPAGVCTGSRPTGVSVSAEPATDTDATPGSDATSVQASGSPQPASHGPPPRGAF